MGASERLNKLKDDLGELAPRQATTDPQPQTGPSASRGRGAEEPTQIPPRGWRDILVRTWGEVQESNLFLVSGGVTYAIILALFPGLAALVSIYGLLLDPKQVEQQVASLSTVLPPQTAEMIGNELHSLVSASSGTLGLSAVVTLLFALWSASRGMSGLITALDIAYQQKETRSFFRFNLIAIGLTILTLIGGVITIALVGVLPAMVGWIGLGVVGQWAVLGLEWPLLIVVVMTGLAVLYRYAPDRKEARWRWVTPGAIVATVLWIVGSIGFSVYVSHFNSYNKTYGALGGVVVMLTWLYLSAFVALLGAVINAQAERQTVADSTEGHAKPLGARDAYAADTVGKTPG
ncbi:YihY/virulence factor BrkB family protein [Rhodopila globiformis]|nr:YihY/virulence factor BrkB family protein [Rhodopila globiformis]